MIISNLICDYLKDNRRITLPEVGTFLSKGCDEPLLFSPMLRGDDGVLCSLIVASEGVDEQQARRVMEEYVEELRSVVGRGESFVMPSLGALTLSDGVYKFEVEVEEWAEAESEVEEESQDEVILDRLSQVLYESEAESRAAAQAEVRKPVSERYVRRTPPQPKRRKFDVWFALSIFAGFLAIFVLIFGLYVEWQVGNISFGESIDNLLFELFYQ